jgi:hypothetical protein
MYQSLNVCLLDKPDVGCFVCYRCSSSCMVCMLDVPDMNSLFVKCTYTDDLFARARCRMVCLLDVPDVEWLVCEIYQMLNSLFARCTRC